MTQVSAKPAVNALRGLRSLFVRSEFSMRVLMLKNLLGYRPARDYGARLLRTCPQRHGLTGGACHFGLNRIADA